MREHEYHCADAHERDGGSHVLVVGAEVADDGGQHDQTVDRVREPVDDMVAVDDMVVVGARRGGPIESHGAMVVTVRKVGLSTFGTRCPAGDVLVLMARHPTRRTTFGAAVREERTDPQV